MDHMSTLSTTRGNSEKTSGTTSSDGMVENWIYSSKNYLQGEDTLTRQGNVYSVTNGSVRSAQPPIHVSLYIFTFGFVRIENFMNILTPFRARVSTSTTARSTGSYVRILWLSGVTTTERCLGPDRCREAHGMQTFKSSLFVCSVAQTLHESIVFADTQPATTELLPQASPTSERSTVHARLTRSDRTRTASRPCLPTNTLTHNHNNNSNSSTGSATSRTHTTHKTRAIRRTTSRTRLPSPGVSPCKSAPTHLLVSTVVLPRTSDVIRPNVSLAKYDVTFVFACSDVIVTSSLF